MSESQDLTLYYAPPSSFSQKVVLALNYLNLKFEKKLVDLFNGEQLQEWYLDVNPKGEVPTLKDGELIVADSADILQYLNDTYDTRRSDEKLLPNPVTPLGRQVQSMNQLLCSVKMMVLTFGVLFYPKYASGSKMSEEERNGRKRVIEATGDLVMEKMKTAASPYKECYNYKLTKMSTSLAVVKQEETLMDEIDSTKKVLDTIEDHLASATGKWLFTNFLTAADITLVVLLNRINLLGLQHHFFSDGLRPKTLAYLNRALNESFVKETFP